MFNWTLFLILILACVPGILVTVTGALKTIGGLAEKRLPPGKELPPRPVLVIVSVVQTLVLVAIAAAAGTAVAGRVGLEAPFFEALAAGEPLWPAVQPQLLPAFVVSVAGALIFVAGYYVFFRPRLDAPTVQAMEDLRHGLGPAARVLYGGIVEEVLMRWGLMSLLAWLGALIAGEATPAVIWIAILVSGVLFGLGHMPSYLAAGCRRSPMFLAAMISLNLWAALIFGWLFWQYGLLAAMIGHSLFHIVWYPFDIYYYRRLKAQPAGQEL